MSSEVTQSILGACTHLVIALFVTASLTAVILLLPKQLCLGQGSGEEEIKIKLLSSVKVCVQILPFEDNIYKLIT